MYGWILGSLTVATWSEVVLILPYIAVSAVVLVAHRRLLDVLRVGEDEANSLGVRSSRVRITIVAAATLGTAAAVAVSGLIGFVGIIVPHTVRLTTNASYRVVLPVSMIGGAAFLILADIAARTVLSPSEIPIGVVTAFVGAPSSCSSCARGASGVARETRAVISLDGVTVHYQSALACPRVTEKIDSGEWVGLIGPNGAGKTTLLRAVAQARSPAGEIRVDDVAVSSLTPKRLARLVAYVFQQPELPPDMTVGQYVLLGRTPHIGYLGFETAEDRHVCGELLESLELEAMADRRLATLWEGNCNGSCWRGPWPSRLRSCCWTSRPAC